MSGSLAAILPWIFTWLLCQVPIALLIGRCLHRAGDLDLPEERPVPAQRLTCAPWRARRDRALDRAFVARSPSLD